MVYSSSNSLTVPPHTTVTISETTYLSELIIKPGGNLVAPDGCSLTLTVDGVETGQKLKTTLGVDNVFVPGIYQGYIVLTVSEANPQTFSTLTFPFREALYLDEDGIEEDLSVLQAIVGKTPTASSLKDFTIASTGENFNGIFAAGGSYSIDNVQIRMDGNGRSDFVGEGAAVMGTGTDTTLVLNNVDIANKGAVRTAVIAAGGSNVIVKNSTIYTKNGTLPSDYTSFAYPANMRTVPWMLGIDDSGNVRATNILDANTKAAYINSSITSDGWGVLSTDSGSNQTLTAINSKISITSGNEGYGTYADGNPYEYLYGCEINVGSYAVINNGGYVYFDDSSPANVAALNTSVPLGLTAQELLASPQKPTIINSDRFGVMWHSSGGTVNVSGGTQINTEETTFLAKTSKAITITIDGSAGAQINPQNGIILDVMDDDDPGAPSYAYEVKTYVDPYYGTTNTPTADSSFDLTSTTDAAALNLTNITLTGDCYNSVGWTQADTTSVAEQNMVVTLTNAKLTGVISSTEAHHRVAIIGHSEYMELGEVTNTPRAAINNGAIVVLDSSSEWTVTATSYLTSLTVSSGATITAPDGYTVTMTVDGTTTSIVAGTTYTGAIIMTVSQE
ncbi:MAG: hypothetical protein H6Q73_3601 [Firmicutes bacterium]|nr:hypothetical protein [Bacillota bacterium]